MAAFGVGVSLQAAGDGSETVIGDCSLPGVAKGTLIQLEQEIDGAVRRTEVCDVLVLPGHWQSDGRGASDCFAPAFGHHGHVREIESPDHAGEMPPLVAVCAFRTPA